MSHYAQNNFNESSSANQKEESNKVLVIVTLIAVAFMFVAFNHAIHKALDC